MYCQLRAMNDVIEGEVISQKLYQLENLLKEIFEQIKVHPEQMDEMHKFMDYYLPTTIKLVKAYEEFDRVSVPGEDILSAKAEIEKTLDTINMAFAELLNKLFRDRAFDAATDAQVLKTMLAREGLTKEPAFAKKNMTEELK
jgi:5-bromo-4-chloroindolyl phosphate hydrolysis protein